MRRRHDSVEDPNHTRIPVRLRVRTCFWGLDHYIRVCIWLYSVAVPSNIVCRIVYTQCLATKDFFTGYKDGIPLCICELAISVALIFSIKESFQYMYNPLTWEWIAVIISVSSRIGTQTCNILWMQGPLYSCEHTSICSEGYSMMWRSDSVCLAPSYPH